MKAIFRLFMLIVMPLFFCIPLQAQPIGIAVIHDKLQTTDNVLANQRMRQDGVKSSCAIPKTPCPGYFGNTGVYYKSYCYTNESVNSECINVKMQANCASQIFYAAYLGSFDHTDVCTNYAADPGLSIANGGSDSLSFTVPAGQQYCIVVSTISAGDTCANYTLTISQFATSWRGSILNTDSTQTQRIHLDGVRYTCANIKQLCATPPDPGLVYRDGYLYTNNTPNDICIRARLYNHCSDTASRLTATAYLHGYDSTDVCYNLAADAGVSAGANDSLWFTFLAPSGANYLVMVYSQQDSVFCNNYEMKLEADFTMGIKEEHLSTSSLAMFPNPITQGANLVINYAGAKDVMVEFYDVTARKIFTKQFFGVDQFNIPTASLTRGIYLVKVFANEREISRKVIVE